MALVFLPPPQSPSTGRGKSLRSGRVSGGVSFFAWCQVALVSFPPPQSPSTGRGKSRCSGRVSGGVSFFAWCQVALVSLQLCGILTVICYSSGQKEPFASFLGTTVMFFKCFPLQLSAIVCMCMGVVKFSGHVTPSWSAVWAIRRGFCGRLLGRGHVTYLQRSF